jgi:hypothetical protein
MSSFVASQARSAERGSFKTPQLSAAAAPSLSVYGVMKNRSLFVVATWPSLVTTTAQAR